MIYEKTLLNTDLKYDSDEEKLYRFNKKLKRFTLIDPFIIYDEFNNKFRYCQARIDNKKIYIHRLIYYVCHNDFDIFNSKITIDHINVDHLDNRLENLRTATIQQQAKNKLKWGGELVKGFSVHNDCRKKKYEGHYTKNKKRFSKCFLTEEEARKFHNDNTERF